MRQEEFLKIFQEALTGKVSDRIIQENINYYRVYIKNEVANGKTEEEVLRMLGDPRLLAKTIEESNKFASGDESYTSENSGWNFQGSRTRQDSHTQSTDIKKVLKVRGWLALAITAVILIAVVSLVFSVISFFAPVILVAAVGFLVYRVITGDSSQN
ncbi:MAG: DUF1700 domain-containing protein [Lachnospiraceae bacterium]|nr:DUF1700 domain-containing protein [Lachnospiraceae bacterium]MBQ6996558.1 DUF1700 domain-containing protein [Lachnospiraceae bacterium]